MTENDWCQTLGIQPPRIETVASHPRANTYTLLLVALLERGGPMTLPEVAERFAAAGIADSDRALRSLKRCRPDRPPVYRVDDHYHLDPQDEELDLWTFRLDLRPPKIASAAPSRATPVREATPLPGPEIRLGTGELDEAWQGQSLYGWSAQRLILAVLDAHGEPLEPAAVRQAVTNRTGLHALRVEPSRFQRRGSPIEVLPDGRLAMAASAATTLLSARKAVRERVAAARRNAAMRPDPEEIERSLAQSRARRDAHAAEFAQLSRALLVAFPADRPVTAALLDFAERRITTFMGDELTELPRQLASFQVIGALGVRELLRELGFDPEDRRLAELGPPRKTRRLNRRGRTLKITTELLVRGSCGISQPFGDPAKLSRYLTQGEHGKLRRRLEADAKSLYAMYQYGRLHGALRLRWGFLDEMLPVLWVHRDEHRLHDLMAAAHAANVRLEVVLGSAPGWNEPWARGRRVAVSANAPGRLHLVDEDGFLVDEADVQSARLPSPRPTH